MAVIQMGAIVSQIKGSIGGTAFKKQRATQVMFRKSSGYSKNKLLLNTALQYSRYIFTRWTDLNPEEKSSWNSLAAILFFVDKFGNSIHITGRQLYTKSNINLRGLQYFSEAPPEFNTLTPLITLSNGLCDPNTQTSSIDIGRVDDVPVYLMVSAEIRQNNLPQPTFTRREAFYIVVNEDAESINFGAELFAKFPYLSSTYNVRYYVDVVNLFGIKGTPLWIDATLTPVAPFFTADNYVVRQDFSTLIQLESNLPIDTIFKAYFQSSDVSMPAPDFLTATEFASLALPETKILAFSYLLSLLPANLRYGNFVRLWLQPFDGVTPLLPAQSFVWDGQESPLYLNEPIAAVFDGSGNTTITFDNDLPSGTMIRVWAQSNDTAMPVADWVASTLVGDFAITAGNTIDIGTALAVAPFYLADGYFGRVWYQPLASPIPLDCPLTLEVESEAPSIAFDITRVTFSSELSGSPFIEEEIFEIPTIIEPYPTGFTQLIVRFENWVVGDAIPDINLCMVDFIGVGSESVLDMFADLYWEEISKAWFLQNLDSSYNGSNTWLVSPQNLQP